MHAKLLTLLLTLSAAISTLAEENLQNCPDESWIYFNNFCYKIVTQKRTFQHAEQECAKLNAELFFPPSISEFGKIVLTIPHSKEFWIDTTLRNNPVWINNPRLDPVQRLYLWPKRLALKEDGKNSSDIECAAFRRVDNIIGGYVCLHSCYEERAYSAVKDYILRTVNLVCLSKMMHLTKLGTNLVCT
ncbi:hypothetical protein T05_10446 [Trichinella murrelli]|uniref:C-type lectin domain-containing protein n=1 Tax=Trichinella murrelli TaxID=144512 RepID=A0A0V0TM01_9BILA|nr:hypothetical protein T05_10446 [Trichinella murrelli]